MQHQVRNLIPCLRFGLVWSLISVPAIFARAAGPDFNQDIRPILSRNCYKCHGPDDEARKADMRLDARAFAIKETASGSIPIVPGKPDDSELIARINAKDAAERMPPQSTNLTLSQQQKELLRRWIASGAEYRPHWSFVPPNSPPLPAVKLDGWARNPIDRFVLAKFEANGLAPSPEADHYTLLRRAALDLTGLQPAPAEVDAVLAKAKAAGWDRAYEHFVDRLLASPQYGERWARRWLDLARYSDTNGFEKDRTRSIWPYRDWVIRAINADMPFDQFTIQQVAGDMLPDASLAQRMATGFHRNTMLNEEGGIDPLEYRFYAMVDRVATTSTTWLGLTMMCAQCHTHKFDPIPHREYYQFMALLDNADEPSLDLPTPEITAQRAQRQKRIEQLTAELPSKYPKVAGNLSAPSASRSKATANKTTSIPVDGTSRRGGMPATMEEAFAKWLDNARKHSGRWTIVRPLEARSGVPLLTVQPDDSVFVSGDQTKSDTYHLKFRTDLRGVTAIRLEVLPDDRLPRHGPGRIFYEGSEGDFMLADFSVHRDGKKQTIARALDSYHSGNNTADKAIDSDLQSFWDIAGSEGRRHVAVFVLDKPLAAPGEFDVEMLCTNYFACGLGRFRIAVTTAPDPEARERSADIEHLLTVADESLTVADRKKLQTQFLLEAPEMATARASWIICSTPSRATRRRLSCRSVRRRTRVTRSFIIAASGSRRKSRSKGACRRSCPICPPVRRATASRSPAGSSRGIIR